MTGLHAMLSAQWWKTYKWLIKTSANSSFDLQSRTPRKSFQLPICSPTEILCSIRLLSNSLRFFFRCESVKLLCLPLFRVASIIQCLPRKEYEAIRACADSYKRCFYCVYTIIIFYNINLLYFNNRREPRCVILGKFITFMHKAN